MSVPIRRSRERRNGDFLTVFVDMLYLKTMQLESFNQSVAQEFLQSIDTEREQTNDTDDRLEQKNPCHLLLQTMGMLPNCTNVVDGEETEDSQHSQR